MKKTVAIFIFSIFWLHAAAQNVSFRQNFVLENPQKFRNFAPQGELKNRLDRLEQAIDGAVNLIKDLHKEESSLNHSNVTFIAIVRPNRWNHFMMNTTTSCKPSIGLRWSDRHRCFLSSCPRSIHFID
jgi:hypothetical protein